jgi:methionine-S-sulfoxide reductase
MTPTQAEGVSSMRICAIIRTSKSNNGSIMPSRVWIFSIILSFGNSAAQADNIVLAGGCFWGVEAVFEHVKGVSEVVSGYAGGEAHDASYDKVSSGITKHAEAVQITYDPKQVGLVQLLTVFFTVAHDPTQLNYQGPDHGPQYRSAIFMPMQRRKKPLGVPLKS